PAVVNFAVKVSGTLDSSTVTLTNNTLRPFSATDVSLFHGDAFSVSETAFTIAPGNSHSIKVYVNPRHNIRYADWLMVKSNTHAEGLSVFVFTLGKYANPYYDGTQNKWHEDLKTALSSLLAFGYTNLGYNNARDQIFVNIDNKKNNGQGASQNTLECIYTGIQAVGFTNRQDAQNSFNFNTEHTMPQSLFGSSPPMVADMHHLYAVTSSSNSERGNKPFGLVTSPNWTVGGSKSNNSTFEPRDAQKARSAAALFYFVLRYQDYNGFVAAQEPILRQWVANFPLDSTDVRRNDDIQALQHNRNPFTDHPEFLERISSITGTASGNPAPIAQFVTDTMNFGQTQVNIYQYGQFLIANQGENDLVLSSITFSDPAFTLFGNPNLTIPKDTVRILTVRFAPPNALINYSATLNLSTNDPNYSTISVSLLGESLTVGVSKPQFDFNIYPNPAATNLHLRFPAQTLDATHLQLFTLDGRIIRKANIVAGAIDYGMNIADLPRGIYLLKVESSLGQMVKKVVLE
ncbi:MAG TPA: T9SS type A sorting domain-containing protein, partial [Bacteroidetes bacterium]|nr:T9SS type A sorting domain-containing protein [Bacteroidota bacterium]